MLSRRALLALGGLAAAPLPAPALAQGQGGAVRLPPLPCTTNPGDIVALLLEGSGAPAGTVVVFGQAFRPGDLPAAAALTARLADGRALLLQFDLKSRHADGSARFGVVSLAAPALRRGERAGVVLARGPARPAAAPLNLAAALAGRSAVVEITPADGGAPFRLDLLDQFAIAQAGAPAGGAGVPWQAGPLAVQARVSRLVPAAQAGGATTPRLVADIALRADGVLWVALWVRNDLAMHSTGGPVSYALRLTLDGREVLRAGPLRHAHYQAWGRSRAAARGSPAAPAAPAVRHDPAYLASMGLVPHYDLAAGVDPGVLARMGQALAAPDWDIPFGPRGVTRYMPTTGGRADIGPATTWQAAWMITGDPRAAELAIGQAEAAGAVPWNFWEEATGTWIAVDRYPRLWTDVRNVTGTPGDPRSLALTHHFPGPDEVGGWRADEAHQPDLCSVPFLLTGQRWMLDNLQGQTAANLVNTYPGHRLEGMGLVANGPQPRAAAWALRQIDNAAWLSPDGTPEKAYFQKLSDTNWSWLVSKIPDWQARQGAAYGWLPGTIGGLGAIAPWTQDYFVTTVVAASLRGNPNARRFLEFMRNFVVNRFTSEAAGFPAAFGAAYSLAVAEPTTQNAIEGTVYQTWAEMAAAQRARGWAPQQPWGNGNYNQLALASLAGLHLALGDEGALQVFRTLNAQRIPGSSLAEYQRDPTFSIVPRGFTRSATPVAACQSARPAAG